MGESVLTTGFNRAAAGLACESIPLEAIAAAVDTPTYVYSASLIREQYERLARAFAPVPHRIHYSVKANGNLAVLALLRGLGAGVDIVSGGELYRANMAGFSGADIVFSGVGKTERELRDALEAGVLLVNVESLGELELLDRLAGEMGVTAPVALRVNPEVRVETPHHYTRTGERGLKFGIPYHEALDAARTAFAMRNVRLRGLDMHIGSQVSNPEPYEAGIDRLMGLAEQVRGIAGDVLHYLDIGGGFAVQYDTESPMDIEAFGEVVCRAVKDTGLTLLLEPGRFVVGNAGVLVTRVLYRKRSGDREYIITDAGMNDLLRPSHYQAYHRIEATRPRGQRVVADIVGPVCESGDFFALDRDVDDVLPGELLVIHSAGAYGFAMASNYNSRPRAAEVLVDGDRFAVVTERERLEDLVRLERTDPEWRAV